MGGIFEELSHTLTTLVDKWGGVNSVTQKHLPTWWISAVVSLHTRVKHLPSLWVTAVVSNSVTQKHLPTWWLSAVVGGL